MHWKFGFKHFFSPFILNVEEVTGKFLQKREAMVILLTGKIRKIIKSKISQVDRQAISVNLKKSHSTKCTKSNFPADGFKRIKQYL